MPGRPTPLLQNEYYHVFNRGHNKQNIFLNTSDYQRFFEVMQFYIPTSPSLKFSRFNQLSPETKSLYLQNYEALDKNVEVMAYCFMPNHFHFLLKQLTENGIALFLSNIQNSYSRYLNIKHNKIGSAFQGTFKSVHIESDEQLLHISRYIHLNPYSSEIVKTIEELLRYPWSSLQEYLNLIKGFCSKELILNLLPINTYKDFVLDQADYQRELDSMKHLLIDLE